MKNSTYISNSFYANKLKNNTINLNNNVQQLDYFEAKLETILDFTYRIFHPLFSDGSEPTHYIINNNYKDDVDIDFDNAYTNKIRNCFVILVGLFYKIYTYFFRKKGNTNFQNKPINKFKSGHLKTNITNSYSKQNNIINVAPT